MSALLSTVLQGFANALLMAWEVGWALVLGFTLSAVVQTWVGPSCPPPSRSARDRTHRRPAPGTAGTLTTPAAHPPAPASACARSTPGLKSQTAFTTT